MFRVEGLGFRALFFGFGLRLLVVLGFQGSLFVQVSGFEAFRVLGF